MRELITGKEAAKRLGVSARTIYRAMKAGKYQVETPNKQAYLIWENGVLLKVDGEQTIK